MKQKFSTHWISSSQPRKQRKYAANAPLHLKVKKMSVALSKELREKYSKRSIGVRKGDSVRIVKGKFKKKEGKVSEVSLKKMKIYVEGIQVKKQDGSKSNVPFRPSNVKIIELNLDDKKRSAKLENKMKKEKSENKPKTEAKK